MNTPALLVEKEGGVATFTLNRPQRRNALNAESWSAILDELRSAEADPSVHVVVIRSDGPVFSAGNDIKESESFATPADAKRYFLDIMVPALEAMARSPLPILAAVQGPAFGGGFELLQFCDVVIAAPEASFQLPETRLGLWATVFVGATHSLGVRRGALELALTAEPYSAAEAAAGGFITRVAAPGALDVEVRALAEGLLGKGRDALARSKRYANRSLISLGLVAVRDALEEHCNETIFSVDGVEGVAAFIEKREPVFADRARTAGAGE